MPSTRHRVELSIAAAFSGVGSRSALPQGAWRASAAPGPAAAEAAKVPAAAHSSAAAVRSGLRGLVVLRAPPDRVQEYLQGRRIGAQTGVKIHVRVNLAAIGRSDRLSDRRRALEPDR